MAVQQISLNESEALFDRRMGLLYGPGITTVGDFYSDLIKKLVPSLAASSNLSYNVFNSLIVHCALY